MANGAGWLSQQQINDIFTREYTRAKQSGLQGNDAFYAAARMVKASMPQDQWFANQDKARNVYELTGPVGDFTMEPQQTIHDPSKLSDPAADPVQQPPVAGSETYQGDPIGRAMMAAPQQEPDQVAPPAQQAAPQPQPAPQPPRSPAVVPVPPPAPGGAGVELELGEPQIIRPVEAAPQTDAEPLTPSVDVPGQQYDLELGEPSVRQGGAGGVERIEPPANALARSGNRMDTWEWLDTDEGQQTVAYLKNMRSRSKRPSGQNVTPNMIANAKGYAEEAGVPADALLAIALIESDQVGRDPKSIKFNPSMLADSGISYSPYGLNAYYQGLPKNVNPFSIGWFTREAAQLLSRHAARTGGNIEEAIMRWNRGSKKRRAAIGPALETARKLLDEYKNVQPAREPIAAVGGSPEPGRGNIYTENPGVDIEGRLGGGFAGKFASTVTSALGESTGTIQRQYAEPGAAVGGGARAEGISEEEYQRALSDAQGEVQRAGAAQPGAQDTGLAGGAGPFDPLFDKLNRLTADLDRQLIGAERKYGARRRGLEGEIAGQESKVRSLIDKYSSQKVDPRRYFKNQSLGAGIMRAVGAMMGALANGLSGGRIPNVALQRIEQGIDRDIRLQLEEIKRAGARADLEGNLLSKMYKELGSVEPAMLATKRVMLDAFRSRAQALMTSGKIVGDTIRARAKAAAKDKGGDVPPKDIRKPIEDGIDTLRGMTYLKRFIANGGYKFLGELKRRVGFENREAAAKALIDTIGFQRWKALTGDVRAEQDVKNSVKAIMPGLLGLFTDGEKAIYNRINALQGETAMQTKNRLIRASKWGSQYDISPLVEDYNDWLQLARDQSYKSKGATGVKVR